MQVFIKNKQVDIDAEDLVLFNQHKWFIGTGNYLIYHQSHSKYSSTIIFFHKKILNTSSQVDHINRNRLDNRKENLRLCEEWQNCFNVTKRMNVKYKSKYKGVCWNTPNKKWFARISHMGKFYTFLYGSPEEHCAYAYNFAAKIIAGDFAYQNPIQITDNRTKQLIEHLVLIALKRT